MKKNTFLQAFLAFCAILCALVACENLTMSDVEECVGDVTEWDDPNCDCDNHQPVYVCFCDTSPYYDCVCDTNTVICDCNVSEYEDKGCACDTINQLPCDCDVSDKDDKNCPCDDIDPPCDCDTTQFRDCDCDIADPVYDCDCNVSQYIDKGCDCDTIDTLSCDCDVSEFKDKGCPCDSIDPPCDCDVTEYNDPDCPCDDTDPEMPESTVSFKKDLQPIWDKHCTECHFAGQETPYLTSDVAYNQLTSTSLYINKNFPNISVLYQQVNDGIMPDGKDRLPQSDIDKILTWIKEGSLNN